MKVPGVTTYKYTSHKVELYKTAQENVIPITKILYYNFGLNYFITNTVK